MSKATKAKRNSFIRRAHRTRAKIRGTAERPRLTVFRSSKHIYAQVIDDTSGTTIVAASDKHVDAKGKKGVEVASLVGAEIAKRAKSANITAVVFDRGAYKYHGRVQALADAAREGGLEF